MGKVKVKRGVSRAARCHVRRGLARTQREARIGAKQQKNNFIKSRVKSNKQEQKLPSGT